MLLEGLLTALGGEPGDGGLFTGSGHCSLSYAAVRGLMSFGPVQVIQNLRRCAAPEPKDPVRRYCASLEPTSKSLGRDCKYSRCSRASMRPSSPSPISLRPVSCAASAVRNATCSSACSGRVALITASTCGSESIVVGAKSVGRGMEFQASGPAPWGRGRLTRPVAWSTVRLRLQVGVEASTGKLADTAETLPEDFGFGRHKLSV